ncbi:DnaJ sub B member 9 [Phytophthora boehmeriae]|uniref:DnaJ sub B member 9 n=1 Tax=Phytophthora boehmeriae TaxID=109152 RepID=A0A8T1XBD9_9STRA|nr:DnaJ sub B member 9 [Phytophthora boehmeriae]
MPQQEDFTCKCGASFPTRINYRDHESCCDHAKVSEWDQDLKLVTSPGSECYTCDRLLSLDDVLYRDMMITCCPFDGTISCPSCREVEAKDELLMSRDDVGKYLCLRRSTMPYPWLQKRRADLFRELQEYLYRPGRVQKWLESGRDLESYLN